MGSITQAIISSHVAMLSYFFFATNDSGYNKNRILKPEYAGASFILTQIKDPGRYKTGAFSVS